MSSSLREHVVDTVGIEPTVSIVSGWRSTTEPCVRISRLQPPSYERELNPRPYQFPRLPARAGMLIVSGSQLLYR